MATDRSHFVMYIFPFENSIPFMNRTSTIETFFQTFSHETMNHGKHLKNEDNTLSTVSMVIAQDISYAASKAWLL